MLKTDGAWCGSTMFDLEGDLLGEFGIPFA
jgi:hypothetical protein